MNRYCYYYTIIGIRDFPTVHSNIAQAYTYTFIFLYWKLDFQSLEKKKNFVSYYSYILFLPELEIIFLMIFIFLKDFQDLGN